MFNAFASMVVLQFPSAALVPILICPLLVPEEFIEVTDLKILVVVTIPPFDPDILSVMTLLLRSNPEITKVVPVAVSYTHLTLPTTPYV